jgi:MFS family permease
LIGPSKLLGLPEYSILIAIGLVSNGFGTSSVFCISLAEAIEVIQQKYMIVNGHDPQLDERLSDCLSSFFTLSYNMAAYLGPIIGGALFEKYGYRDAIDINMSINFIFLIILIFFNCGFNVINKYRKLQNDLEKLNSYKNE